MPTNDFKAFAVAPGANVLSQSDYNSLAAVSTGWQGGVAKSAEVNKAMRQATFIVAALAQFVSDKSNQDVLDDGNISGFVTKLITAFNQTSQPLDATLTAIAGLAGSANKLAYFTGADTASLTDFTDVGRNIIGKNAIADVLTYLGLGSAAKAQAGDFISSGGGNYSAYLRLTGVETLPTEAASGNLSSLYSAPSPISPGSVAAGFTANWYGTQIISGVIRGASNGSLGYGVDINGTRLFQIDMSGNAYANGVKLSTELYASNQAYQAQTNAKSYADTTFVPLMRKVNNKALSSDISLSASDVGAISSGGGNYPAILRMTGLETIPTEPSASNLSALYSAPSPVQAGSVASGTVHNWYSTQIIAGLIRNASTGSNGWGVFVNGQLRFLVDLSGNVYAGGTNKLATEAYVNQNFVQDVRLGAEVTAPASNHDGGYVLTAFDASGGGATTLYRRPLQKLINGSWVTVGSM